MKQSDKHEGDDEKNRERQAEDLDVLAPVGGCGEAMDPKDETAGQADAFVPELIKL